MLEKLSHTNILCSGPKCSLTIEEADMAFWIKHKQYFPYNNSAVSAKQMFLSLPFPQKITLNLYIC
jgi:hypothetical protein